MGMASTQPTIPIARGRGRLGGWAGPDSQWPPKARLKSSYLGPFLFYFHFTFLLCIFLLFCIYLREQTNFVTDETWHINTRHCYELAQQVSIYFEK